MAKNLSQTHASCALGRHVDPIIADTARTAFTELELQRAAQVCATMAYFTRKVADMYKSIDRIDRQVVAAEEALRNQSGTNDEAVSEAEKRYAEALTFRELASAARDEFRKMADTIADIAGVKGSA